MANNNGGPWGGGGGRNGGDNRGDDNRGGRRPGGPGDNGQIPEIDEIMKKGQEQLRVLMGGRGGGTNGRGPSGGGAGPKMTKGTLGLAGIAILGLWLYSSFYTVRPEEQSVELFLGEFSAVGNPGLNFAPWPLVTAEVLPVTRENTEEIGTSRGSTRGGDGLMLTTDENIVDIDFDVVWNISDPAAFLFNLADGQETVRAVSEAAMREVIAQQVQDRIQSTLDSYDSGINIVRLNLDRADPPEQVIDAFREVQAAEQERDRLERQADAYANRVLAGARGEAAQLLEEAEAYRAQVVNEAEGEASRFTAVLAEYQNAPEVTRKRLYLETMERVLGGIDKVILDSDAEGGGGQGVVPYLPLNELRRTGGTN